MREPKGGNLLEPRASEGMGFPSMPDCSHIWRPIGPGTHLCVEYAQELGTSFSSLELRNIAHQCDQLILNAGGIYPALVAIQEDEVRKLKPQLDFVHVHRELCPVQYPALMQPLEQGAQAHYTSGSGGALDYEAYLTTWGRLGARLSLRRRSGRTFEHAGSSFVRLQWSPMTYLLKPHPLPLWKKKNPDHTVSLDRRIIAEMRRINLGFPESQYYPARVPSLESLARLLVTMTVALPGLTLEMTKRDIASAFRLLRLRPSLLLLMCTELPGMHFGCERDFVFFYLAMPFGWNGEPVNFALFGDAISAIHSHFGVDDSSWFAPFPSQSRLYADDGMLYYIRNRVRQKANSEAWGADYYRRSG